MPDRIHFGSFSKATDGFVSSTFESDFELFQSENLNFMSKGYELSYHSQLQLSFFMKDKHKVDVKDLFLSGCDFRIVSLKAVGDNWVNMLSFLAVLSASGPDAPDKEELESVKKELLPLLNASKEAIEKWGDKTCFLIW